MDKLSPIKPEEPRDSSLNHFKCTRCFGIVGTEAESPDELTCICGGKLKEIDGQS